MTHLVVHHAYILHNHTLLQYQHFPFAFLLENHIVYDELHLPSQSRSYVPLKHPSCLNHLQVQTSASLYRQFHLICRRWQCNHKFDGDKRCETPHLDEDSIKDIFIKATNELLADKDEIIANFEIMKSTAFNTEDLETQKIELQNELEVVAKMIQDIINENAHTALDQEEYQRKYDGLVKRFESD